MDSSNRGLSAARVNELLQQGIITQADFDIKKKQILGL